MPLGSSSDRKSLLRPTTISGRLSLDANVVRNSLIHCENIVRARPAAGASQIGTHHSLHVYQTEPLADVIADDYQVGLEQSPAFGAGRVVEFETVFSFAGAYLEYEGLVYIPEKGDGGLAGEVLAALADSPVCGLAYGLTAWIGVGNSIFCIVVYQIDGRKSE